MISKCFFNLFYNSFLSVLILNAGDINLKSGQIKKLYLCFSCRHWNIYNLTTGNYCKVLALKVSNTIYKYNCLCVSEIFFSSSFESNTKGVSKAII